MIVTCERFSDLCLFQIPGVRFIFIIHAVGMHIFIMYNIFTGADTGFRKVGGGGVRVTVKYQNGQFSHAHVRRFFPSL